MKTRQKLPVRFWHGMNLKKVLDELTPADKKQLNRLMSGDENSELNLEKLRNSSVYSLRVNSGRRILFTTIQGKGKEKNKHIALILEILPTHDYTNAKCLKPQVLNQFLKRANIEGLVFEAVTHVEGIEKSESPIDDDEIDLELIEYVYDKGRGITLTDEQQNIQHHLEMPCYILGMGGCGKTSVINAIIIDRVEEHVLHDTVPALPIVYVTESKPLADAQRAQWMQHPLASTPAGERVLFLSSSEAIASYSTAVRVAGYHEIKDNDLIKRIQAKVKSLSFNKFDTESNVQKLMHEFEIIAACETDKTYFTLGQHQSNYTNQSERKLLWRASEEIKNTLQVDGLYSARLYREKPGTLEKQCSLVIIDEAHSGARVVKLNLKRLSEYFIGCVDSLQSMQKAISDVTYLIEHTGTTTTKPANIYTLKQNFRNPARVIHLANGLNRLRRFVLGGKGDKTEQTTFDSTAASDDNIGTVTFIENKNINKLIETVNTDRADFAIITTAENKEKAKLRYKNPQVFTAPEIGGLEYDNIIIDNLFDKNILAQLNTVLSAYTPEAKVSVNRPKETSAYTDTNSFFNILNTAFTRPRKRLYIVDASPDRKTQAFYKHIIDLINTGDKTYASTVEVKSDDVRSESTPADWMARVDELVLNNKMSMARDIWINHLQLPEQTFVEKYQPSVEHPNILFRLDLDDLALPRLAELKKMLNKRNYHSLFLDCKKDQPGLMFKLLSSTDGQDRIEALFQHNFEKTASLFCALLNSNLEIRIPDEEPQDVFMWLILDVHRGSIVNRLAERHPAFANKMIAEMEKRLPVIKEGVDESKEKLIPLVMILGVISPTLFEQTFMKFPDRVKASMCHFWFHRVTSDDHPNGAPFIVHLADDTPRDTLSYLDGVDFPIHHFISPDGEINAPTVNALLVTRGGVRLLNRCLYEPASPIQAARLSCDEFMLEPIASIRHQSKGTRFDYLLSRGNASGHWVKSYLIYHPNRVAFFTARVPSRENPAVSISRIASFFENRAFTTTMIGLAKTAPDEVRTIFKDVNFHFLTAQNEYFLVYLIYSSFSLPDGSDIIGLDVFALLLDVMKSGLIRLENLGEFMKEFLKVQTIDAESTITCLGYLTRYKPASFVQLLRCYPALVTFITHEDLTDLNYDFKKRCLIELILMTEINGNRFLAIYAFLTASDYYLFRTTPVDTWLRSDIANSLCENPLGVTLLLKLIELTSVDALLDYNKNHFSAVMQLNSLEKTRKVFIAMKTKIQSNTTPEPLALEVPKTIEAPTMTQSTSVEQYFGSMDLAQIEISELTTLIKNTPDASVKAKILAFLRKVKFHENHHESKEEVITTFMKLSEKADGRQFIVACFEEYGRQWIRFDEDSIALLFKIFNSSVADVCNSAAGYFLEEKIEIFYHLGVCFPEMIDCLRDQFLKDRPEIGAVGTYFYGLTLSDNAQLVLNTIFAREALSTTQLDKLITELSMRHRVHEDQSFHHFSWNSLVLIIEGRELRQFFITLVEKNPELLRKLPLEAWSSPVDPYDQPTDSRNYVSLYLFKRSIEGIAYFENHSENYPDLVAATKNPCEYQFNTDEECQDLLTTSYIKHYQKQYKPDNLTLTQLKDFGISPTGNRLLDLFYNKDILSLLSYRPQTTNVNIEFNLFCTLLQNPKSCKDLLFFFDNSSYIMRSFFDRIDFQSVVVCHKKSISYQKLLFSSKQSLSIIECFIRHYPGKLRHYSTFDQSFSEFKPADFDNLFGSCNSILQETLKKEFPALQLITVTKKEEKVTSNTSTHFTQPVQPKNKTHANNKKRRPKK